MKTEIWSKKDFTLGELFDVVINCESNTKILNSCFTPEFTKNHLELNIISHFEPIDEFYLDSYKTLTVSVWKNGNITIGDLEERLFPLDCTIERDVDDGYVYSNYENIVFNENYIVLC